MLKGCCNQLLLLFLLLLLYVCVCVFIYNYINIYIHVCMYLKIYIFVCIYIYIYIYIYCIYIYIYCTVYATLHLERENQWVMYYIVFIHCLKSNSNFLHKTWNQVENMILHTWNSPCSITFSLLHFMLYRFPLGQCTVYKGYPWLQ